MKKDIDKLDALDPGERLAATLKMFPSSKRDQNFHSTATGALYPRGRHSFLDVLADLTDDDDDDDDDRDDVEKGADHCASTIAELLVEAGSHSNRPAALDYLLHSPRGQALLSRMKATKQTGSKGKTHGDIHRIP